MDNFNLKKYLGKNPLLKEIKVNTPGTQFTFTDKFKQDFSDYNQLNKLLTKFTEDDLATVRDNLVDEYSFYRDMLNIDIYFDEQILFLDKTNKIETFIDGLFNRLGSYSEGEQDQIYKFLKEWMQKGWITPINI